MKMWVLLFNVLALTTVHAKPLPQVKTGSCPAGYRESGGYCAPTSDRAPVAVPKVGQCPSVICAERGILPRHPAAALIQSPLSGANPETFAHSEPFSC